MSEFDHITTNAAVAIFEASGGVFAGLLSEMRELSKKKPDVTLNNSKVQLLNRVLDDVLAILSDEPEGKYLHLLDNDELPQNSDAVLMMAQFERALFAFKDRYTRHVNGQKRWVTEENIIVWDEEARRDAEFLDDDDDYEN